MPGPFYFAYIDGPIDFDPDVHNVEDDAIIALTIAQDEGDFASLEIDVRNPGTGLLAPSRKQWCWLSWFDGAEIVPLFTGRLIASHEQIIGEAIRLMFRAKPLDFEQQKLVLAEALRVLPFVDPVWTKTDPNDPDAVLECYGARWHIGRTDLTLTISDELQGEDGTILAGASDHTYENFDRSFASDPKTEFRYHAELGWTQSGQGTIDLTEALYNLFRSKKSIYVAQPRAGIISTLTGDGLKNDWPKGGTSFGGGWTVNNETTIDYADPRIFAPYTYDVPYKGLAPGFDLEDAGGLGNFFFEGMTDWIEKFNVSALKQSTRFDWLAEIKRIEVLEFTMSVDLQPLSDDSDGDQSIETISVSATDTVTQPDDDGNLPILDKRLPAYLNTDRGLLSVQNRMLHSRALARRAARAVQSTARISFAAGVAVTLRKNLDLTDPRIEGGELVGKIISYKLAASGTGQNFCDVTVGSAIGHGGEVAAAADGEGLWVDDGWVEPGWQQMAGAQIAGAVDDLVFQSLDDFPIDDDGVNLLTLDDVSAVDTLTLTGGLSDQVAAVNDSADPVETIKFFPSRVCLQLKPVAGKSFETTYSPEIEPLPIPKQIDLEVA